MTVSLRGHDYSNYGQQSSKKYVFKREQKTGNDGADVIMIIIIIIIIAMELSASVIGVGAA